MHAGLFVEWHLRRRLAPLPFGEDDPQGARANRASPVEKAGVSESARAKSATKLTSEGFPVHSMATLIADLATLTASPDHVSEMMTLTQHRYKSPWAITREGGERALSDRDKPTEQSLVGSAPDEC